MIRGIVVFLFVWLMVSLGILSFSRMPGCSKVSAIKIVLYGAITAGLSVGAIGFMIVLF